MAATQRAVQVVTVAHPVALSARSLVFGRERLARLVLGTLVLFAWVLGFGASASGLIAACAATGLAWIVGSSLLRDRGEYHRALAVRLVRHAQAATLVTALVIASAALLHTGAEPLRLGAASFAGFLAVAGWDVRRHRTRTTERPLRVLGLGAGEEAARARRRVRPARGPRRRARRLRRQSLARGRAGARRARRSLRGRFALRDRRDRPDRQPPAVAPARAPARRRSDAGRPRAHRPLRARLRLRPGRGDQRGLVHRGARASAPPAQLGAASLRRSRRRRRSPPSCSPR